MLAEGVVAGGSVAGVMVTPPPLPHAPFACCHGYDAAHPLAATPASTNLTYRLIFICFS